MAGKAVSITALAVSLTAIAVSLVLYFDRPTRAAAQVRQGSITVSDTAVVVPSKASLIRIAKHYVRLQAERDIGISVDRQEVTGFQKRGTVVIVSLHDTLSNWNSKKTFDVDVTLNEGAWQPLGMHVITEHGPPPIGVPAPAS